MQSIVEEAILNAGDWITFKRNLLPGALNSVMLRRI